MKSSGRTFRSCQPQKTRCCDIESASPGITITIGHRDFYAVDVMHSVPSLGYTVQNSGGVFAVSGDTKTNETFVAGTECL